MANCPSVLPLLYPMGMTTAAALSRFSREYICSTGISFLISGVASGFFPAGVLPDACPTGCCAACAAFTAGACAGFGWLPCGSCGGCTMLFPCDMAGVIPIACPTSSGIGIYASIPYCPGMPSSGRISSPPQSPAALSAKPESMYAPSVSTPPAPASICASKGASVTSGSISSSLSANCSPKPASESARPTAAVSASSTNLLPNCPSSVLYFCASALAMKFSSSSLRCRYTLASTMAT